MLASDGPYTGLRRALHGQSPNLGEVGLQVDRSMLERYAEPYAEPYSPKVGAKMGNLMHLKFVLRFSSNEILRNLSTKIHSSNGIPRKP